ncbi:expressed unknown protein [Seminavis robusta]|uniref:Uncharacterized protein n=1 Tax=Seminavis robusta TaxID=568900 RepID=A0A9N8HQ24_9STRA|nr:expressed unknown protein [Seminavis robusta]|eukprot:Sro1127_g244170.1 n/a (861) ;mRNA; r:11460-14566
MLMATYLQLLLPLSCLWVVATGQPAVACGDFEADVCRAVEGEECCLKECAVEMQNLFVCLIREATGADYSGCSMAQCPVTSATIAKAQQSTGKQFGVLDLDLIQMEVLGIEFVVEDAYVNCPFEWDAAFRCALVDCVKFLDVCPEVVADEQEESTSVLDPASATFCEDYEAIFCDSLVNDDFEECCIKECSAEIFDLMVCIAFETTGFDHSDCAVPTCGGLAGSSIARGTNQPRQFLSDIPLNLLVDADFAQENCPQSWDATLQCLIRDCPNLIDVCPDLSEPVPPLPPGTTVPNPSPVTMPTSSDISFPVSGVPDCAELADDICDSVAGADTQDCCLSACVNALHALTVCVIGKITGEDRTNCEVPTCTTTAPLKTAMAFPKQGLSPGPDELMLSLGGVAFTAAVAMESCPNEWDATFQCLIRDCPNAIDVCPNLAQDPAANVGTVVPNPSPVTMPTSTGIQPGSPSSTPVTIPPTTEEGCYSSLTAIYDASSFDSLQRFVLCPNTTIDVGFLVPGIGFDKGQPPLVPRSNRQYLCGEDGKAENNCVIRGGDFGLIAVPVFFRQDLYVNNVTISGFTFQGQVQYSVFGAVAGDISFHDCVFKDTANFGPVVLNYDSTLDLSRHLRKGETENPWDDAMEFIQGCQGRSPLSFERRKSRGNGRNLQEKIMKVTMTDCLFDNLQQIERKLGVEFGIITVKGPDHIVTLERCTFSNNQYGNATLAPIGYGISVEGASIVLQDVCFIDNDFRGAGAVLLEQTLDPFDVESGFLIGNYITKLDDDLDCTFAAWYPTLEDLRLANFTCVPPQVDECLANNSTEGEDLSGLVVTDAPTAAPGSEDSDGNYSNVGNLLIGGGDTDIDP